MSIKVLEHFANTRRFHTTETHKNKQKVGQKKRRQKSGKKTAKTIEKIIEKESEKEAQQIVDMKAIANDLALSIIEANRQLDLYLDFKEDEIKKGLIDTRKVQQLTSALKNLNDILSDRKEDDNTTESLADSIQKAYENRVGDE